jgi:hypothetical protein
MLKDSQRTLYRIISGRTTLIVGGLSFCVIEPDSFLIAESYDYYDQFFDEAYAAGCLVDQEFEQFLFFNDIWSKSHDGVYESKKDEIDNLKVLAYENYFREKDLGRIKRQIRFAEKSAAKMIAEKSKYDFLKCSYVAESARLNWLLAKCTYIGPCLVDESYDIGAITNAYFDKTIDGISIRDAANSDSWRNIWYNNKTHGGQLFNRSPIDYTRDQISLCSFSSMYDNVYEHYERPDEKVINDHDCLDGWFIVQRRKNESERKKSQVLSKNPKIANAKEQFIFANDQKEADTIYNMNDQFTRSTLKQRFEQIATNEKVKDIDFNDVQQDIMIKQNNMAFKKGRK